MATRNGITLFIGLLCACAMGALSLPGQAVDRHVPTPYRTIQSAVDASLPGDVVVIAPGTYYEQVRIVHKTSLVLRGESALRFVGDEACFDSVEREVRDVLLVGTLYVLSSTGVRIERLTVIGPGPALLVEGTETCYASDLSVRYCNLVSFSGPAIGLGTYHRHVSVACTNARMKDDRSPLLGSINPSERRDALLTCTRVVADPVSVDLASSTSDRIVVAVIDSGIDWAIPDLACRAWVNTGEVPGNGIDDDGNGYVDDVRGWDFRDNDADSQTGTSIHWHGTFVAGQIISAAEQRTVTPEMCAVSIMDLRFLDENGLFYTSDWQRLVEAIEYAVSQGARIINLSLYAARYPPAEVRQAIQRAVEQGVVVVAIAGNDAGELGPIAQWEEVIAVGAVDRWGKPAAFSNSGAGIDLVSYGVDVLGLIPGGRLAVGSGTSFSAPRVAGVAAYHLAESRDLSISDLLRRLIHDATDLGQPGWDESTGWGLVE